MSGDRHRSNLLAERNVSSAKTGDKPLPDAKEKKNTQKSNGSTGDQIGGQSPHSEAEIEGRVEGLPKE